MSIACNLINYKFIALTPYRTEAKLKWSERRKKDHSSKKKIEEGNSIGNLSRTMRLNLFRYLCEALAVRKKKNRKFMAYCAQHCM